MGNSMHFSPSPSTETVYDEGFIDISPKLSCVYGAASLQGWGKNPDRFSCLSKFCNNVSFFAVYDGHGGSEISEYLQANLYEEIKSNLESQQDIEIAIYLAFLSADLTLKHPQTISQVDLEQDIENQDSSCIARQSDSDAVKQVLMQRDGEDNTASANVVSGPRSTNGVGITVSNSGADNTVTSSAVPGFASTSSADNSISTSTSGISASDPIEDDTASSSATGITASTTAAHKLPPTGDSQESVSSSTVQDSVSKGVSKGSGASYSAQESGSANQSDNSNNVYSAATSGSAKSNVDVSVAGPSQVYDSSTEEDTEIDEDSYDENLEEDVSDVALEKPLDYLLNEELEPSDSEDDDFCYGDEETESEGTDDEYNESSIKKMTAKEFANMQPGDYSGSTATVVLLDEETIYVANVGDSKCVLSRKGLAIEMSVDHKPTVAEEQERIVRNGGVVRMGRINDSIDMSRAFGNFRLKGKSEDPPEQCVTAEPSIKSIPITKDDEFLIIATEGIWNSMTSQEVVDCINMRYKQGGCDLRDLCYELFQLILSPDLDNDGIKCDNMSCIIIKLGSKDSLLYGTPSESHSSGSIG